MGCGESKIKQISLTTSSDWDHADDDEDRGRTLWTGDVWQGLDTRGVLPNSLLSSIPSNDLGDSLDVRNREHDDDNNEEESYKNRERSAPDSANSLGINYIIT